MHFRLYEAKWPNLKLKTRPKQPSGSLLIDITHPGKIYRQQWQPIHLASKISELAGPISFVQHSTFVFIISPST
jgi:hypothetical protein